jgi:hypothetical protein
MAQVLDTIEGYIANVRKRDTIYIGFNPNYAKEALKISAEDSIPDNWLDKKMTNWEKRDEFKQFMSETLPNIVLTGVFDYVHPGYIEWPFLGTIAIDVEIDSPEYHLINNRYEDEHGEPYSLDAVVYLMSYDNAKRRYEKRKEYEDDDEI